MVGTHAIINNDLFDIAARLKEIDPCYFVVRNYKQRRFELHASDQKGGTLALVLPFERLDARVLSLARQTRFERAARLIEQMERQNEARERAAMDALAQRLKDTMNESRL